MVMVEPSFLALTTTPSMTGSAAELTMPASAAGDWARTGAAIPNWNRTAAVAAVEASNAFRFRMAFPSEFEIRGPNVSEPAEFGRVTDRPGGSNFRQPRPACRWLQGGRAAATMSSLNPYNQSHEGAGPSAGSKFVKIGRRLTRTT